MYEDFLILNLCKVLLIPTGTFVTGHEARKAPLANSLSGELEVKDP